MAYEEWVIDVLMHILLSGNSCILIGRAGSSKKCMCFSNAASFKIIQTAGHFWGAGACKSEASHFLIVSIKQSILSVWKKSKWIFLGFFPQKMLWFWKTKFNITIIFKEYSEAGGGRGGVPAYRFLGNYRFEEKWRGSCKERIFMFKLQMLDWLKLQVTILIISMG